MRIRLRPLPVMTVASTVAFVVLILFGAWQWQRYEDKRHVRTLAPATVSLAPFAPLPEGRQLVYALRDGAPGWRVFVPVRYGGRSVFVDADFLPGAQPPDWRRVAPPKALDGARAISGVAVRPPRAGAFAARGDPAARLWYAIDLSAMAAAAGLTDAEPWYVAMPYVGADGRATENPFAAGPAADPLPPERHLGYAMTWWGLAAGLVGVYLAFHARSGRLTIR